MNTVRFNDSLPEDVIAKNGLGKRMEKAPIFFHQDLEENDLLKPINDRETNLDLFDGVENNPNLFPFPMMRMYLKPNAVDALNCRGWKLWIAHEQGSLTLIIQDVPFKNSGRDATVYLFVGGHKVSSPHGCFEGYSAMIYDGRLITKEQMPERLQRSYGDFIQGIFTSLSFFLHLVNSKSEFVAQVHPEPSGRSVEWLAARTHYVLIHRSHPANFAAIERGAIVTTDSEYLKKQAHSRRAHDRILRSQKFRHKQGQKIRIKACWVGPKEWREGTSIYRLQ